MSGHGDGVGVLGDVSVSGLTVEYQVDPMPLDEAAPRFGWHIDAPRRRGVMQLAYEIAVHREAPDASRSVAWESGRVESDRSVAVPYTGPPLQARTLYVWAVRVWVDDGGPTAWSLAARWETGLQRQDWIASWAEPVQRPARPAPPPSMQDLVTDSGTVDHSLLNPAQYVRRELSVRPGLLRARVYATAHGIYTAEVNGRQLGDLELAPEATSYGSLLMYQAYDATAHLHEGDNAIGFVVADGWWAGRLGMTGHALNYGDTLGLLAQVELHYADGSLDIIATDESWRSSTGGIVYADLLVGERVDARLEPVGWTRPGFDDSAWTPVGVADTQLDNITAQIGEPVRPWAELPCVETYPTADGAQVLDFGQVVTGHVRLLLTALDGHGAGTEVRLRHFQVTDTHGDHFDNVLARNNENLDVYVARGTGDEVFEPRHTFHAFRYVKVSGLPRAVDPSRATAVAISSDVTSDFTLRTSDPRVDRLQDAISWTLRDNFVSIPMDNPDRERAGWTGDLAAVAPTAMANLGLHAFLHRFMANLAVEQFDDGTVPMVVPFFEGYRQFFTGVGAYTSAGWGDVVTLVPWAAYLTYGDLRLLEDSFPLMQRFHGSVRRAAEASLTADDRNDDDLSAIRRSVGFHFGDWLTPSVVEVSPAGMYDVAHGLRTAELMPTLYYARSTDVLADVADLLGHHGEAADYRALAARTRRGFSKAFVTGSGRLTLDMQGSYVLALAFRMSPEHDRTFLARLVELIHENDGHLDTGFQSTALLLPVLTEHGHSDLAHSMMLAEGLPSWMHMLENGATTIWEMWQGIAEDGSPNRASFVQPGLSTVGAWLTQHVAGIRPGRAGYRHIELHPVPGHRLSWAEGRYQSVQGEIVSRWQVQSGVMHLEVTVPAGASATVVLEGARLHETALDNLPVIDHPDVRATAQHDTCAQVDVGSGDYGFTYPVHPAVPVTLPPTTGALQQASPGYRDLASTSYADLVANPDVAVLLDGLAPELVAHPMTGMLSALPFELVLRWGTAQLGQDRAQHVREALTHVLRRGQSPAVRRAR